MKKIERYDNYKLIPIPPQCTTTQCEFKRVSDNEKCTVSIKDLDQLERERGEAIDALIEDAIELDKCRPHTLGAIGIKLWSTLDKRIALIERLTGQEWQELKEMKG